MPEALSEEQIAAYGDQGFLVLERRVPIAVIETIRAEVARFEGLAQGMTASDARIDLEDSHRPDAPRIRRVKLPHRQSAAIDALMRSDLVLAPVRDLIGPDLRLRTSKLNMKSAGFGAAVEWHQDFAFYPHTNDDLLAVGILIDDMSPENGPLMVFPGTHKGPILDHHHNGVFAGAVDLARAGFDQADAAALMGPAGSITLHHARALHGSALNTSARDRRIIFFEILAADAFPLFGVDDGPQDLDAFDAQMLCGSRTLSPRLAPVPVRLPLPKPPTTGSIYELQKAMGARAFAVHGAAS